MFYARAIQRQIALISIGAAFGFWVLYFLHSSNHINTIRKHLCSETFVKQLSYAESVLEITRWRIELELSDYNFTNTDANKLEDLVMERGGTPLRSLIVSTWRSGSSFLGDVLNAMPSNFYHYEPLLHFGNHQINQHRHLIKAKNMLKHMLRCNFHDMQVFPKFVDKKMKTGQFRFNHRIWDHCKYEKRICADANFTSKFCKLFPFQSMKLVRLRLRFLQDILRDKKLNVKIVLLIRDPRAVMQSRQQVDFCKMPDCLDAERLCSGMTSDYDAAKQFLQRYPNRLMVLRFEDVVLNLNATTLQLLKFLKFSPHPSVEKFISSHTRDAAASTNAFSTYRNSREVVFKWKTLMDFGDISDIQDVCKDAMEVWGYQLADNASHMESKQFYPVKTYSIT